MKTSKIYYKKAKTAQVFSWAVLLKKLFFYKLAIVFLLLGNGLNAQNFDFNKSCKLIYNQVVSLNFCAADSLLISEKKRQKNNPILDYLSCYRNFYELIIGEENRQYELFFTSMKTQLNKIENANKNSPYFLYTQAEMKFFSCIGEFKFGNNWRAAFDFYTSYKLIKKNQEKFPNFQLNKKLWGIFQLLAGLIPEKYRWATQAFGLQGNIESGLQNLKSFRQYTQSDTTFKIESIILLAFAKSIYNSDKNTAFEMLKKQPKLLENAIFRFAYAHTAAAASKNEELIEMLSKYKQKKTEFPVYHLDFLLGTAKLNRLDADANIYLERYVENFKGQNYIKQAYWKLAWFYFFNGRDNLFQQAVNQLNTKGNTYISADKQALHESEQSPKLNVYLLKARLLFDGGYYRKSLQILEKKQAFSSLKTENERLEYSYRLARVYHRLEKMNKAIGFYISTLQNGKSSKRYFAAFSAFQLGNLFRQNNETEKAKKYYKICLKLDNEEYKHSIRLKAKMALKTLEE